MLTCAKLDLNAPEVSKDHGHVALAHEESPKSPNDAKLSPVRERVQTSMHYMDETFASETVRRCAVQPKNTWFADQKMDLPALVDHESGNRDANASIECVAADGVTLDPSGIAWHDSSSEWTEWLEKVFAPLSAERLDDPSDRRRLILDGHSIHHTHHFLERANNLQINVEFLPSHTTW